ncbi:hypothetical protein niasHT_002197 [Heterodera trifolii]|uniref:Uncharacterized protein n=1 Tax=Heterodera trifolii TaxID=157864 RepID=A0ABD2LXX4_9BILA
MNCREHLEKNLNLRNGHALHQQTTAKRNFSWMKGRQLQNLSYGSIPKSAFRFGTFEFLKGHAVDERGNLSPFMRLACGLGAGISEAIFNIGKAALPWFFKGQKQASWSCEPSKSAGNSTCARVVE